LAIRNPAQRVKGQEVSILITTDDVLEETLVDIQNFDLEAKFEIKEVGYLGEKTNRHDEIYNGCKGSLELHMHKQDFFRFQFNIKQRARRETPDRIFNITAVAAFPNGDTPQILVPDVFFGSNPLNVNSRGDYVKAKLEIGADDFVATLST
jgi:hypothetical protein